LRKKLKTEFHDNVWTEDIVFYLDGVTFILKYHPLDQACAPWGKIWRKPQEWLAPFCKGKGSHCGSGGPLVTCFVAVSYGKGLILCEKYDSLKQTDWKGDRENVWSISEGFETIYSRWRSQLEQCTRSCFLEKNGCKAHGYTIKKPGFKSAWEHFRSHKKDATTRSYKKEHHPRNLSRILRMCYDNIQKPQSKFHWQCHRVNEQQNWHDNPE